MSIIDLKRQNARSNYPSGLDRQNLRRRQFGLIDVANRNTNMLLTGNAQDTIENSWGAPAVEIPVFSKNVGTATAATLTCEFKGDDAVAQFAQITFLSACVGFRIIPRMSDQSNIVTQADEFMRNYMDKEEALAIFLEDQIALAIDNAKATQYNSGYVGAGSLFPLVNDALQVDAADQDFFWNYMKSILKSDDFYGMQNEMVASPEIEATWMKYVNQGAGNSQNTAFQFAGYTSTSSRSIPVSTGAFGTGYVFPEGSVGLLGRVSPDALNRRTAEGGKIRWWSEESDLLGIPVEWMFQDRCADVSAITGNASDTNAVVYDYQMGINAAIVLAFDESDNNGVKKFDFLLP